MTHDIRLSTRTRFDEIRAWRHGELPLPEWIPPHMIGDIELNGTFEVSTELTIIDGQHRWMAVCQRDDIPQLPCCVFRYESMKEEARMFIVANRARKPISRLDDYYAALAAADEDALEIEQLVRAAGFRTARSTSCAAWRPGEIAFTSAIARTIQKFGAPIASGALTNLAVAFQDQKLTHGGALFGALVQIMSRPSPDFDPDRLLGALSSRNADAWGECVKGISSGNEREAALRAAIMGVCYE